MNIRNIKLKEDNRVPYGGLSHSEETLEEFMADLKPNEKRTIEDVNLALNECGILQISKINYPEVQNIDCFRL